MASIQQWTFVLCCIVLIGQPVYSQCVSSGPNNAGTSASVSYPGSNFSFSNVGGALNSDDSRANSFTLLSIISGATEYLQATNFGFNIPTTAVICGITAEVEKSATGIGMFTNVADRDVYIVKNGALAGVDQASAALWTDTDTYSSYGGATALWGTTWTPADINAADFGIAISANVTGSLSVVPVARIDHIRITVHYYEPPLLSAAVRDWDLRVIDGKVRLGWTAAGASQFLVQRSIDSEHWQTIGEVADQYKFVDTDPLPGRSYYRLVVMDVDGSQTYTFSKSLLLPAQPSIQCYPNPFAGALYVSGAGGQQVRLKDAFGRVVAMGKGPLYDLSRLPAGVYVVSVGSWTAKVVKR